jgi:hypothetical protein
MPNFINNFLSSISQRCSDGFSNGFWNSFSISLIMSIIIFIVFFYPSFRRSDQIANLFVQPTNITSFSIFLAGFIIGFISIAKDIALKIETFPPSRMPYFYMIFIASFLALITAFGAISYTDQLPVSTFSSTGEVIDHLEKITGTKYDPKLKRFSLQNSNAQLDTKEDKPLEEQSLDVSTESKEKYEIFVGKVYESLAASKIKTASVFFNLVNLTATFGLIASANLILAAVSKFLE